MSEAVVVRRGLRLQSFRRYINASLCYERIILIAGTAIAVYLLQSIYGMIPLDGIHEGLKRYFFKTIRRIPRIRNKINEEIEKYRKCMNKDMTNILKGDGDECRFILELPFDGYDTDDILGNLKEYMQLGHSSWQKECSGTVCHEENEIIVLNTKLLEISGWINPLHPNVFPGIFKMEAEIVRMVGTLFHGESQCCGTMTCGGTESIILAVKAYRDWAFEEKGISYPEILVPKTAHPAFEKATQLLHMGIRFIPVNEKTCQVDIKAMKKMISKNTCMLVGSTPGYPHGIIDDIKRIAELGVQYKIPVHVDANLGGFLLAFMPRSGYPIPPFDFSVPGVTSISVNIDKYGFAPKGSSILLYGERKFKHFQHFVQTNWPGGLYGSTTIGGSISVATIAGCWSILLYFGLNGYIETTRRIIKTARNIKEELRKITGIYVIGNPIVSVLALASDTFDIFRISDALKKNGWCVNNLQFPSCIHICVTYCHTYPGVAERFIRDIETAVEVLMIDPSATVDGVVAICSESQKIHDRSIIGELIKVYLDTLGNTNLVE